MPVKSLLIVHSYHHRNTEKIAQAIAGVLDAPVQNPGDVSGDDIGKYDLIGFGSGIYGGSVHPSILALIDRLPMAGGTNAFIFSTYGAPAGIAGREFVEKNHDRARQKLRDRGFRVIGEFGCAGWNTNSFLKYFGGLNRGRPDASDCADAETFARSLVIQVTGHEPEKIPLR